MEIIVLDNEQAASKLACDMVCEQIREKRDSVIGFATGGTPLLMYQELIKEYNKGRVDFSEVISFNLDEYIGLKKEDQQSYNAYMHKNLFDHVNIQEKNIHIPDGDAQDPEREALNYEVLLKEYGGIDLQILGIGRNGHIGFNEPGTSFSSRTSVVKLTRETIDDNSRFFDSIEDVPTHAISMGIGSIMEAKKIILLAFGEQKDEAIYGAYCGEVTEKLPASVLQRHNDATLLVDKKAARKVTCLD